MTDSIDSKSEEAPQPDPALQRLNRLIGNWQLKGRSLGSTQDDITGKTTFSWLHGDNEKSFFMQQDMEMNYGGVLIRSHEIIGFDPKTKAFTSHVYSNMAPDPWPYQWDIRGDEISISITYGQMDAAFHGKFSSDGSSFSGGWRPNPGADEKINAGYDITATRTK